MDRVCTPAAVILSMIGSGAAAAPLCVGVGRAHGAEPSGPVEAFHVR
jgi:hypothetical protein